jgi:VanZ family protein
MAENITTARDSILMRVVKYWLPVLVMLGAMFNFSTDHFSGDNTRGLIDRVVGWFFSGAGESTIWAINVLVRKAAHFVEYAFLAALLFRAFRADSPERWRVSWAAYSLAVVACWAAADEYHQTLTRSRSGSVSDALLDIAGGLFMLALIARFNRRGRLTRPSE